MPARTSSDPDPTGVALLASEEKAAVFSRVDLALMFETKLLVYGWIVGFADSVRTASIDIGGLVFDLTKQAAKVRRPDVAEHFGLAPEKDRHGFYALLDLPSESPSLPDFQLRVTLATGERSESRWPLAYDDRPAALAIEPYLATLKSVLRLLPKYEARRLIVFANPALGDADALDLLPSLPLPVEFGVDLCCVLDNALLVVSGWRLDPASELTRAELRLGDSTFSFLDDSISFSRPDVKCELTRGSKREATQLPGFIFVHFIPEMDAQKEEAQFYFRAGVSSVRITHPLCHLPHEAKRNFLSLVSKMDADSAIILIDYLATVIEHHPGGQPLHALLDLLRSHTIERLPPSLNQSSPRYSLHLDSVIPIAESGMFLLGWFNAEPGANLKISVHCGAATFALSDAWSLHTRRDVTTHLAATGVQTANHQHGFCCYVPIVSIDEVCYLSVVSESGEIRRMRATVPRKPESALQTVRSLVTSFHSAHPELRALLDRHIGPAIGEVWASRRKPPATATLRSFGPAPDNPSVSIIVPLYGRYDFAQYQLAMFADDAEFQHLELIYFVDDPAILADFTRSCADLYGIYGVPFVVASAGANLGYAGANNLAARYARGKHLIFLNSDVFPKQTGWVSGLLRTYLSLPQAGVLGAKLLYEDGSVQHAGMAFHRYPGWGDLWINDHPFKGQSPLHLDGVKEIDCVTAACAVVEASLFLTMGGFSEDYIIGDFEDSDLCLRLIAAGRRNYIDLDIELYHLERQSQNSLNDITWRTNLTLYNCWLHDRRWGKLIAERNGAGAS